MSGGCIDNPIRIDNNMILRFCRLNRYIAVGDITGDTGWVTGCQSWYLDKHGNPAMWPFTFDKFCDDMSAPDLDEYELVS